MPAYYAPDYAIQCLRSEIFMNLSTYRLLHSVQTRDTKCLKRELFKLGTLEVFCAQNRAIRLASQ